MSLTPLDELEDLSLSLLEQVDAVCERFERAWKLARSGQAPPDLAAALAEVPAAAREHLFRELLGLDLEYRRARGEQPTPADYAEFQEFADRIRSIFQEEDTEVDADRDEGLQVAAGRVLGDYELLNRLGSGGMGIVFRARQRSTQRLVALKILRPDRLAELSPARRAAWLRRFQTEALTTARLEHEHIVAIHTAGEADGLPFYAMRYIEGLSLAEILDRGPLSYRQAAHYLEQVARAVEHAHTRGILHRDLKPRNILVDEHDRAFVTDFGLARWREGTGQMTQTGDWLGTPVYMSPEQIHDPAHVTAASDVYSLGATLYELLTGRPPIRGETIYDTLQQIQTADPVPPACLQVGLPRDLEIICLKCLQKDPAKRYGSAAELADDLQRFLAGVPIHARPLRWHERLAQQTRRYPALAAGIAVSAAALLLFLAGGFWHVLWLGHALETTSKLRQVAQEERDAALKQKTLAEEHARLIRYYEYAANMRRAQQIWNGGDLRQLLQVLRAWEPQSGEEDLRDFAWWYLWHLGRSAYRTIPVTARDVYHVTFSPGGSLVATAARDGCARIHDVATGSERLLLRGHKGEIGRARFSPDGQTLATCGEDGTIRLWSTATGTQEAILTAGSVPILCLLFTPDGKGLISGGKDGKIRVWDVPTRTEQAVLGTHPKHLEALALTPDGRLLAGVSIDGIVSLWDLPERRSRGGGRWSVHHIHTLALSPDGRTLVLGGGPGTLEWRDLESGQTWTTDEAHTDTIQSVAFSPDGQVLASAGNDLTVRLWDVRSRRLRETLRAHTERIWSVTFSPDGRWLATASRDGTTRILDPHANPDHGTLDWAIPGGIHALAFTPSGDHLVCGDEAGSVWCHALASGKMVTGLTTTNFGTVVSLSIAPDGRRIAAANLEGTLRVWDRTTGTVRALGRLARRDVGGAAFQLDGRFLLHLAGDRRVHRLDLEGNDNRDLLPDGPANTVGLALSPDGRLLATAHTDHTAKLRNAADGLLLRDLRGHRASIFALAFTADGRVLATGGEDRTVRLWDTATGQERLSLLGHADRILSVAFSPDGRVVATGSSDRSVRVWSARTGQEMLRWDHHNGPVHALAFSPNGRLLVSGGDAPEQRGEVRLWLAD